MPTNETRKQKYKDSTENIQNLYSSSESGQILFDVFSKNGLLDTKYSQYVLIVGDIILGFFPKTQLSQLLEANLGVSKDVASNIAADLTEFLSPIPDGVATTTEATPPQPIANIETVVPPLQNTPPEIRATPAAQSEPPLIPRYAKPLTDLPRYNDTNQ